MITDFGGNACNWHKITVELWTRPDLTEIDTTTGSGSTYSTLSPNSVFVINQLVPAASINPQWYLPYTIDLSSIRQKRASAIETAETTRTGEYFYLENRDDRSNIWIDFYFSDANDALKFKLAIP